MPTGYGIVMAIYERNVGWVGIMWDVISSQPKFAQLSLKKYSIVLAIYESYNWLFQWDKQKHVGLSENRVYSQL